MDNDLGKDKILLMLSDTQESVFLCATQSFKTIQFGHENPKSSKKLRSFVDISDIDCINTLRMNRNAFSGWCFLLENIGGLAHTKNISVSEVFLSVLAYHNNKRVVKYDFK